MNITINTNFIKKFILVLFFKSILILSSDNSISLIKTNYFISASCIGLSLANIIAASVLRNQDNKTSQEDITIDNIQKSLKKNLLADGLMLTGLSLLGIGYYNLKETAANN